VRVLITGGRDWEDEYAIDVIVAGLAALTAGVNERFQLIHGHCPTGADAMADTWKDVVDVVRFPADWSVGKKAGPLRNRQMLDEEPDLVIAFHDDLASSKGTKDCVGEARRRGIPVWQLVHVP